MDDLDWLYGGCYHDTCPGEDDGEDDEVTVKPPGPHLPGGFVVQPAREELAGCRSGSYLLPCPSLNRQVPVS